MVAGRVEQILERRVPPPPWHPLEVAVADNVQKVEQDEVGTDEGVGVMAEESGDKESRGEVGMYAMFFRIGWDVPEFGSGMIDVWW